jgi:hypothetical protein
MRTKTQNQWIAALLPALALVLASYGGPAAAYAASTGDQVGPMGRIIATETTTATATVQAVDRAKRTVTLRSPDGTTSIYKVPKEAVNFDEIEVGDQVKATLVESLAVALRKADEPPSAGESQAVALAPKGAKPGGIIVDTAQLTARVTAVDMAKRTVTLVGPAGNRRTLKVGPNVDLTKVQPGDNVVVRYTEALALMVEKPSGATVQPSSARVPATEEGAANAVAPMEGLIVADATTATATIQAVDREKRTVTLRSPDGTTNTYKLSKHVINFDEIKVGDQVKATTVDSLAVVIRKADEPPSIGEEEAVALAPKGAKPGVVVANTMELTATIKAIDRAKRTVTLAGPAGSTRMLKVGPDVDLTKVQPGDSVVVRYTEALALRVESPSGATVRPAAAQVPPKTGEALKANMAVQIVEARKANAALMRQYTWESRTELIDKGEIRDIRLERVTYGPDGSLQRVLLNNQGASLPHGFLRRSIAEDKKKQMEEYLTGLRGLLDQYTLPTAGKILDFMNRATLVGPDASGLIMMTGSSVVLPGDSLTIWTDAATRQMRKVQVKTYFQDDGVELTATFKTLPGGPTHVAFADVIVPAKQLTVQVQNFDYVRTASAP